MARFLVVMTRTRVVKEHAVVEITEGSKYYAERNAPTRAEWEPDSVKIAELLITSCLELEA